MPTIRPAELRRQADAIADLVDQPEALEPALVKLLTFYTDRTRRAPNSMTSVEAARGFGVPRPVLQALMKSLGEALTSRPELRQRVVRALWASDYAETRELAAELLSQAAWPQVVDQVEEWARGSLDAGSIEALASRALRAWDRQDQVDAAGPLALWLHSSDPTLNRLGLLALESQVRRAPETDLPSYFPALQGLLGRFQGASQRVLLDVFGYLIEENPSETARFLMDELRRQNLDSACVSFVRRLLSSFPEPQRSELAHTLSPR